MHTIVYITPPAHGHLNPALPVIRELVERGERLIVYNTEEFRPQIEQAGAEFRAYPATALTASTIMYLLQNGNIANITELILRATEQLLPFMRTELTSLQPDLVIFDSIALWGKMAATQMSLPSVGSHTFFVSDDRQIKLSDGVRMVWQVLPRLPGMLAARRRLVARYGAAFPVAQPLFPLRGHMNLLFTARTLQPDTPIVDETFRFIGPSIDQRTRSGSFPHESLEPAPLIYISLGTVHTNTAFVHTCLQAFAESPLRFVLSVGPQIDIASLGPIPANFIVRPFVPQLELLERAAVFITHGGMNSIHEGLYYGVPLVLIPHQFEQLMNARYVAARGAGTILDHYVKHRPLPPAALQQALANVSTEPRYRAAAQQLQQALRATGGYQQAANEIQVYLADRVGTREP